MAAPPHLKAAYVVVAPYDLLANSYMGGVLKEKDSIGWQKQQGASDEVLDRQRSRVSDDIFWNRGAMSTNRKYIKIPMFNVGGWYDIFNHGNISNFEYLQNEGAKGARGNQKLMMGPFGHGELSGDLEYPGSDRLSLGGDQEIRWFDYWLKGADNGIMDEPPVSYFMMGPARKGAYSPTNGVRTSANWPPANREVRYYLTPDKGLVAKAPAAADVKVTYRYDPANPVPTVGRRQPHLRARPRGPARHRRARRLPSLQHPRAGQDRDHRGPREGRALRRHRRPRQPTSWPSWWTSTRTATRPWCWMRRSAPATGAAGCPTT